MSQQKYCQAHLVATPAVVYKAKRWRCQQCADRLHDAHSRAGKHKTAPSSPFTANLQPRIVASPAPYVPMRAYVVPQSMLDAEKKALEQSWRVRPSLYP